MIFGAVFLLGLFVLAFVQAPATRNTPAGNNDSIWLFFGMIGLVGLVIGLASTWLDDWRDKRKRANS